MFIVQETRVESSIPDIRFACELKACKGACCTMPGGLGAPLLDSELSEIEQALPVVQRYLDENHLQTIKKQGMWEGHSGSYTTTCYQHAACVFVTYEDGIAKCSFEKAFFRGEISWRKPLSCHLFPLRVRGDHRDQLHFEYLPECRPALENGARKGARLVDFLKEALVRAKGTPWYEELLHRSNGARSKNEGMNAKAV
ncbi:MAG: DUF3109 family protein [Bacteroidota bacterium]